jgi:4-hydroxy-2-oxoheptanedioate aldolase
MVSIRPNRAKRKVAAGEHVFGMMLDILHPDVIEIAGILDYDFILIDGEHFLYDQNTYMNLIRAADLYGMTSMIRLEKLESDWVGRLMDMGIQMEAAFDELRQGEPRAEIPAETDHAAPI